MGWGVPHDIRMELFGAESVKSKRTRFYFTTKEMNPIMRKSVSKLVMQPRFRAVGQTHVKWQTFEKPENKRQMYGSESTRHKFLLFSGFSNVYHFACVWSTAPKLGRVTNLDTLFLVMGFISLVDEIQFMTET